MIQALDANAYALRQRIRQGDPHGSVDLLDKPDGKLLVFPSSSKDPKIINHAEYCLDVSLFLLRQNINELNDILQEKKRYIDATEKVSR